MSDKTVRSDIYNAISKSAYKKRLGPGVVTDGDVARMKRSIPMGGQRDTLEYRAAPKAKITNMPYEEPGALAGMIGGAVLGARGFGGKFGKGRAFSKPNLNFGMRSLGAGVGGVSGTIAGSAADQNLGLGKYRRKK